MIFLADISGSVGFVFEQTGGSVKVGSVGNGRP